MKTVALAFILTLWMAPDSSAQLMNQHGRIPRIGDPMPCIPSDTMMYMIRSAQLAWGCEIVVDGAKFFVGTIDKKRIAYISTEDHLVTTPEGIHVGNRLDDVLHANGSEIIAEPGWGYFSRLPSGWNALYAGVPGLDTVGGSLIRRDSIVARLFQR